MDKKVLVTGGAGFIGSHLVDRLVQDGWCVTIVDDLSRGKVENLNPKAKFYKCELNENKLHDIIEQAAPNIVFHLAAQIDIRLSVNNPMADAETNIKGSLNLLQACHHKGVERIIFSSTGGAMYGDPNELPVGEDLLPAPDSPYAISKLAVEHYLRFYEKVYGIKSVSLRYGNVYGPRQDSLGEAGVIAIFTQAVLSGKRPTIYGDGEQLRDYIYIDDVVDANIASIDYDIPYPINIGTGIGTSVNKLYKRIATSIEFSSQPHYAEARPGEIMRCFLDCKAALAYLKWYYKVSLYDGLERTIRWYKERREGCT